MRIAFLTTIVPNTLRTGSEIASRALLTVLEELGHEVTLYGYGRSPFRVAPPVANTVLLATIPIETALAPRADKIAWAARSLRSGIPISSEKYNYLPPETLAAEIRRGKPDFLILEHVNLYPFVEPLTKEMPTGIVFQDLQAHSYAMVAERERRPWWRAVYAREARLNAELESRAAAGARFAWFYSQGDVDRAHEELGIRDAEVLPLYFPLPEPGPNSAAPTISAPQPLYDVALIGTWTWPPVRQSMQWFLDAVVPRLPVDMRIAVAGTGSLDLMSDRLIKLGLVPDAAAFLASAKVAAVPTVAGTGIQMKTLELAATGTPAVSTPLGVRGIDDVPANIRVAETPEDFARVLVTAVEAPLPHDPEGGRIWNLARKDAAISMVRRALAAL